MLGFLTLLNEIFSTRHTCNHWLTLGFQTAWHSILSVCTLQQKRNKWHRQSDKSHSIADSCFSDGPGSHPQEKIREKDISAAIQQEKPTSKFQPGPCVVNVDVCHFCSTHVKELCIVLCMRVLTLSGLKWPFSFRERMAILTVLLNPRLQQFQKLTTFQAGHPCRQHVFTVHAASTYISCVPARGHQKLKLQLDRWLVSSGWCSTLTLLLICSSFSRECDHPLLICSSRSAQPSIKSYNLTQGAALGITAQWENDVPTKIANGQTHEKPTQINSWSLVEHKISISRPSV